MILLLIKTNPFINELLTSIRKNKEIVNLK